MRERFWKLPGLRAVPLTIRGFLASVGAVALASLACLPAIRAYAADVSGDLMGTTAQIGAALFVAFAIESSWLLKEDRRRGPNREDWVGNTSGIGLCGLIGIGFAVGLSDHHGPRGEIEELLVSWSFVSIAMIGFVVALLPYAMYLWTHAIHTSYDD